MNGRAGLNCAATSGIVVILALMKVCSVNPVLNAVAALPCLEGFIIGELAAFRLRCGRAVLPEAYGEVGTRAK